MSGGLPIKPSKPSSWRGTDLVHMRRMGDHRDIAQLRTEPGLKVVAVYRWHFQIQKDDIHGAKRRDERFQVSQPV